MAASDAKDSERAKADVDYQARLRALLSREYEFKAALAKVTNSAGAIEASLTCLGCMELLRGGAVRRGCGHAICGGCAAAAVAKSGSADTPSECAECGEASELVTLPMIDELAAKFGYQKQAMAALPPLGEAGNLSRRGSAAA